MSEHAGPRNLLPYVARASRTRGASFVVREPLRVRRITFPRTVQLARRFGAELESRGLRKGDRIIVWGGSSPEWIVAFLGALVRGIVVVPLDDLAGVDFARRVQSLAGCKLAAVSRASLANARAALGESVPLVVLEDLPRELGDRPDPDQPDVDLGLDDVLEIMFTSGTTAAPKGVVITHGNVVANLAPMDHALARVRPIVPLVPRRCYVSAVPLSHMFGQISGIFFALLTGVGAVFVSTPRPGAVREALRAESALGLVVVPRLLAALRRGLEAELSSEGRLEGHVELRERLEGASWPRRFWAFRTQRAHFGWRLLVINCGGAALPGDEEAAWRALGYLVAPGYGMTETAPVVSCASPLDDAIGAVGRPLPGTEVRLAEDGEVQVRGACVSPGYLTVDGVRPAAAPDGWLHTGDVGELDDDGRLWIRGRTKDVIVTASGLNVHAADVERALGRQPGVRDAAVVARSAGDGDAVHAFVLLEGHLGSTAADRSTAAERAVAAANAELQDYQRIRSHEVWPHDDFPRTLATGKVAKRKLAGALQRTADGEREPLADVLTTLGGADDAVGATGEATLTALGLTSLDVAELVTRVEDEHAVDLGDVLVTGETTLAELRALTSGRGARRARFRMPRLAPTLPGRVIGAGIRNAVLRPVLARYCRPWTVRGLEKLSRLERPAMFVGNHCSFLDAPSVFRALPGRIRWAIATPMAIEPFSPLFTGEGRPAELAVQWARYQLSSFAFNGFPLPRKGGFRPSLAHAVSLVERGHDLLLFPEGLMSRDGTLKPFKTGSGLLAVELGIPVVPFRLRGLHEVMPPQAGWNPVPGPVEITFGDPVRFARDEAPEDVTLRLEQLVAEA